ncbi:ECF transporter S component [Tyzzerella sp. An114]|uniref:ECF transporter S component n=1 Tax=Tyzzerella sp. An114 TaxID=1965545 RepID=UPI0013024F5B|nr:ECF transporter S component [Tyzzerella sp. An114]
MSSTTAAVKVRRTDTSKVVKIGMLSAVSIVLMMFEISFPIFPFFLKMDISDIPALVGTVAMGPLAGVLIELIKNVLHLFKTSTAGVGELANFLTGIALVVPIGVMYKKNHTLKNFVIGSIIGACVMVVVACVFNYYILIPAFAKTFGTDIEEFVNIANAVTPMVVDFKTLIFFSIAPFNLLKAVIVAPVAYLVCKVLKPVFNR